MGDVEAHKASIKLRTDSVELVRKNKTVKTRNVETAKWYASSTRQPWL
jgi:hypothetical protein